MPDLRASLPLTADGDYDLPVTPQSVRFLSAGGVFDGATVTFQYDAGGGYFVDFTDGAFTAGGKFRAEIPGSTIRVTLSGAVATTAIHIQF